MPFRYNPFTGDLDYAMGPGTGTASIEFATDGGSANPTGAGVITLAGGTGITTSGSGSTVTIDLDSPVSVSNGGTGASSLTDNAVLVGSGTAAVTALTVGTNGQVLVGSTGADPVFATLTSSDSLLTLTGGAGTLDLVSNQAVSASSTLTDYAVVCGDGGTRGTQSIAGVGTSGQVLTSNGAGALPTFQAPAVDGPGSSTDNALARWSGTGGDTLQDSTVTVTDNGEMVNTSQPCFAASLTATASNVTGDGTNYQIVFNNEIFDQNSDFDTGTGVFTAPVTGKYYISGTVSLTGLTTSHNDWLIQLDMSNNTNQQPVRVDPGQILLSGGTNLSFSRIVDMDALDTLNLNTQVSGSTAVVDVQGGSGLRYTCLTGALIC